ncbi:hypothetical protein QQZ08_004890 [Neonectria magnoliae]|uniref:Uncharacterized protein n=1 Tax=Neonectria magnoliae TaxID=2732573 RepID=A0ABR1I6X7_9HYPO
MKHTCCTYDSSTLESLEVPTRAILRGTYQPVHTMDPEEIAEIQEEDQYSATRLDDLVEEFESKFCELNQPFDEFFFGYWWGKMDEVEAEKEVLSREVIEAIRETGVVLEDV